MTVTTTRSRNNDKVALVSMDDTRATTPIFGIIFHSKVYYLKGFIKTIDKGCEEKEAFVFFSSNLPRTPHPI